MEQPVSYYVEHYFHMPEFIWFLLLAVAGLLLVIGIIWCYAHLSVKGEAGQKSPAALQRQRLRLAREINFQNHVECLFELIFCGGAILGFMATYYLVNRFCFMEPFRSSWDRYHDYLLLALIILFILLNRLVDNILIRLRISHDDKTAVRLLGMVYMLIIFFYIKFIYENNNYDMFITYFLTLMIGRFVYFDVSFGDFKTSVQSALQKLPVMILALAYLAFMSWVGFSSQYLVKHIGVLTNVFFIHLFMIIAIALVFYGYRIWNR